MTTKRRFIAGVSSLTLMLALCLTQPCAGEELATPEEYFGFKPGADGAE